MCVCVPPQAGKSARLLLLVQWLSATNKPTNMQECTAAFLSFLYQHSIGLAWCQYSLHNISLSHVHIHLLLLLSALSWPGASDPAPYSCHPSPLYRLPILPTHARARTHTHTCVPPQAGKSARLLLLVRWLSATNKPTNMQECTAALLSFLYQHSIGLAWCQYILVPCPYSPPPPPCLRFLVARSIRPSPLLLSPPFPYSCHPYPLYQHTCITGI